MRGGGAQENDEGHIDHGEQRISGQSEGGGLLSPSCILFLLGVGDKAL
jgi:hypothetical protein